MKTGYVDIYSQIKGRHQAIVVLFEDWTVKCFDNKLQLKWEKLVSHAIHEHDNAMTYFSMDEVGIHIAPLSLQEDAPPGLVIIGASMKMKEEYVTNLLRMEEGTLMFESGSKEHPFMELRSKYEHFSLYALEASSGKILWKHDGQDVRPEQYVRSLPQQAFKLNINDIMSQAHHAPGLNDWTVFRQSLINELPHIWKSKTDTFIRIAHFIRKHIGAGSQSQISKKANSKAPKSVTKSLPSLSISSKDQVNNAKKDGKKRNNDISKMGASSSGRFTGLEMPPVAEDATLPHDASEHTYHPNVIVSHTKRGLEVNALRTGMPITALSLSGGDGYVDIDGDGLVDTIIVLRNAADALQQGSKFAHPHHDLHHCSVMVVSGLPPRTQLFNGTICQRKRHLDEPMDHSRGRRRRSPDKKKKTTMPPDISVATPAILRTVDHRTFEEAKIRDLIVANNLGIVTAYNGEGEFLWQVCYYKPYHKHVHDRSNT
jgi:hypothetical protein